METKVCKECGQSLPKSNFSKNKATKDGLANYCKKCDKERRRKSSGYTGELRYSKVVNI